MKNKNLILIVEGGSSITDNIISFNKLENLGVAMVFNAQPKSSKKH